MRRTARRSSAASAENNAPNDTPRIRVTGAPLPLLALPLGELSSRSSSPLGSPSGRAVEPEARLRGPCRLAQPENENLSVSPAGCRLSFQERQGNCRCRAGGETERVMRKNCTLCTAPNAVWKCARIVCQTGSIFQLSNSTPSITSYPDSRTRENSILDI